MVARPGRPLAWPQKSLLELAALLFSAPVGEIAGRGEARRVARGLVERCRQRLVPLAPDDGVRQLLDSAGFLWEEPFAAGRAALAGEYVVAGRSRLWVAGPGAFRRRLLAGVASARGLRGRLRSPEARSHWRRRREASCAPPVDSARRLLARGRFEMAQRIAESARGVEAAALGIRCRTRLGRLEAARRALSRLDPTHLGGDELAELAETAVSLHANQGRAEAARPWVERALRRASGSLHGRALLSAASLARECGDLVEMDRCLQLARPAADDAGAAWRWRQAAGLAALARRDPAAACRHLGRAVRDSRRRMDRFEAASLWNDLAVARADAGDLAGAERALLHAVRLHERLDGPRRTTLALCNLAELRLRRGRVDGVREILDRSARRNRADGNWRGLAYDRELVARYELARGRPERALERVESALDELGRRRLHERESALHAVAGRALGWLGRAGSASRSLDRMRGGPAGLFEPEELPALQALAGRRAEALESVAGGPAASLWLGVLGGVGPEPAEWGRLAELEPYRAARLVADLELVAPGSAPRRRARWAARVLERAGNRWLARRLEGSLSGAWSAVESYLAVERRSASDLPELFRRAGYAGAFLGWRRAAAEHVIVPGAGGDEERRAALAGGSLVLRADRIDGVLRALFALALRDWRPPPLVSAARAEGVIGSCPALLSALDRARRLAAREVPILILGETGTGKELVARHVHRSSSRQGGSLLSLNSATLSESLVLSDLFGHARGAFTGADRDRAGIFEAARDGTVFLDELGDLPLQAQGMLLRVLQEGEVRRLGESRVRRVDVRVIGATHRPLERLTADGRFRQDLFYRLAVGRIELPPLRERGGDLELLTDHFLRRFSSDRRVGLTDRARDRLAAHDWPGNVRELANCLAVAVALAEDGVVSVRHLGLPESEAANRGGYHQRVLDFRRRLVADALDAADGNRAAAARRLGMSRQALSYLVRALRLE